MKVTFLIAASLLAGAAVAQTMPDASTPPAPTSDMSTQAPAPAPTPDMTPAPAPAPMDSAAPATMPSPPASSVAPSPPDTSNYPPCSRTMHDRCVQTHEMARKHR